MSAPLDPSDNRQAGAEITEDMIDAGAAALDEVAIDLRDGFVTSGDVAVAVYHAMFRARR
jgi:hypothetical protein